MMRKEQREKQEESWLVLWNDDHDVVDGNMKKARASGNGHVVCCLCTVIWVMSDAAVLYKLDLVTYQAISYSFCVKPHFS